MKYLLLAASVLFSATALAQGAQIGTLDVNNYRTPVLPSTALWRTYARVNGSQSGESQIPKITAPGQHPRSTMYFAGLWLGGEDSNGLLYVAAETYRQGGPPDRGFWTGPISQLSSAPRTDNPAYDSVWSVTRTQINTHRAQYAQPGYQMPRAIAAWPGHVPGTSPVERLAPFADLNGNNLYEPALGEYPDVPGDQALFFVCNDMAGIKRPASPAMGVDVHGLVYAFAGAGPADPLASTAFIRYTISNRSNRAYHNLLIGHWADLDIGYWNDDYVGSDRARRMLYAYNGSVFDRDTVYRVSLGAGQFRNDTLYGYGNNPPAQAIQLLSDTLRAAVTYENDFSVNGNPTAAVHFYNYLGGKITNGVDLKYGGNGVTGTNGQPWPWMFDGDPVTGTGWTETSAGRAPYDRRGLISAGPYTLPVGGSQMFEMAYIYAQGPGGGAAPQLASVAALQQAAGQVLRSYQNGTLAAPHPTETAAVFTLAPNPASHTATVYTALVAGTTTTLILRDGLGRPVRTLAVRAAATPLDLRGLAPGLYHATLTTLEGRALASQRLVVVE